MPTYRTILSRLAMTAAAVCVFAAPSEATEGYSAIGFGARTKALAGAGVADSRDATAGSLNPAGLVHVGDEIDVSMSAFSPRRGFDTTGGTPNAFLPIDASVDSDKNWFFIPNLAWSTRKFANPLFDVMAFNMVGNGGMNTSFNNGSTCSQGAPGVFCAGASGINLLQMVMSVAFAKQIAPGISVGVAPMFALQSFDGRGLEAFGNPAPASASLDPANLSGSRNDWSYGFGVRGGVEFEPMKGFRIGVAGTSRIYMEDFNKYRGLFANGGEFDIPPSLHAGIAVDVSPALTLMLDYRHIWFSSVDSVGNPSANLLQCFGGGGGLVAGAHQQFCLGGTNGAGFGWKDVDVVKFGIEYRANEKLTLRGGYAWNTQPVRKEDVTLNTLAPAVTQHHITGGFAYNLGGGYHLEMAGMYAPEVSVTGQNVFDPTQTVEIHMHQYEITAGIKYKFGEASEPLK